MIFSNYMNEILSLGMSIVSLLISAMSRSIFDYFHLKNGHPDPRSQLPSQALALANKGAKKVLREKGNSIKHVVPSNTTAPFE